jgi:hypothetical protein
MVKDSSMSMPPDPFLEKLCRFIRGDLAPREFEAWICAEPLAEQRLGPELYLDTVSADFRSPDTVERLRGDLRKYARSNIPCDCRCIELPDLAVLPMGAEGANVLGTIQEIKRRGQPYWWLSVQRCRACNQWWLVAQEERHNDVFCLRRLDASQGVAVVEQGRWPSEFDNYETLLRIGRDAGYHATFIDPLGSSSIPWTIEELARARPGIRVSEIGQLLGLDIMVVRALAERVASTTGVAIEFD